MLDKNVLDQDNIMDQNKTDSSQKVPENFIFKELDTLNALVANSIGMPEDLRERLIQMIQRLDRMAKLGHYASEFDTLSR